MIGRLGVMVTFFALRIGCALILLKVAASRLSVAAFADFTQYLAFASLVALLAVGGTQNGLIRQTAAARSRTDLGDTAAAAAAIWLTASALLLLLAILAAPAIGTVLVGHSRTGPAIVMLTAIAILAGPGQIRCSMLTGQGRMAASLAIQGIGLLVGASGAAWFTFHGQPVKAAIAFACGSLIPSIPALALIGRQYSFPPRAALLAQAKQLLRFSLAFGSVAAAIPLTLLALRWQYRGAFGNEALGQWLSANRISDLSTQLIGLFMLQIFVPHVAQTSDEMARRRFILKCGVAGMAVMAVPLIAFSAAPTTLVRLFLSPSFVPAIPAIKTYMAGDMLRVWTSMAIYTAFATGRAERYAAMELTVIGLMAAVTALLVSQGYAGAPQWTYFFIHAGFSAIFLAYLLLPRARAAASMTADAASFTSKTSIRQL